MLKMNTDELLINKIELSNLLYIYKNCLTKKQYEVLDLYINEDLSISEISDEINVSRQAIFDMIKKTQKNLYDLENKIGFKKKLDYNEKTIEKVINELNILNIENEKIYELIEKLR